MAPVTVVTAVYVADTSRYVKAVGQATDATKQFAGALPQAEGASSRFSAANMALAASVGTLGAIAFAKAAAAIKNYAMQGIQAAAQFEQTVISIEGIFVGTGQSVKEAAAKTQTYLADLRDFAARTPFELPQTLNAVKRLLSIGYTADEVKNNMLPTIGDIVAALGQPASAIDGVVYAMGQMKSAGRVMSQDLMQIGNALPGFNAKMEIAKEMFNGDVGAMTKAMEKGSVDSTQAIEAMLKAMQKFPGAAGAMDRQSKTLNGTISTFKDTINNALIDGLIPFIPAISQALNGLMPTVEGLAKSFAGTLGPALGDMITAFVAISPAITDVVPPLIELLSAASSMSSIIVALSPIITVLAKGLGVLASAVASLPGPLLATVGIFIIFQRIMQAQNGIMGSLGNGIRGVKGHIDALRTSTVSATTTMSGFKSAGSGLFAALGGPWGAALAVGAVALAHFADQAASAKARTMEFRDSVDAATGALNEAGLARIAEQLRADINPEDWKTLERLGITVSDVTTAIAGSEGTWRAFKNTAAGMRAAMASTDSDRSLLSVLTDNAAALRGEVEAGTQAWRDAQASQDDAAASARQLTADTDLLGKSTQLAASKSAAMTAAQDAIVRAGQRVIDMFSRLNAMLSKDAARDQIISGWKRLDEAFDKTKGKMKPGNEAKQAWREQMQAIVSYADQFIEDPVKRLEFLKTRMKRVRQELASGGSYTVAAHGSGKNKVPEKTVSYGGMSKNEIDALMKPYQREVAKTVGVVDAAKTAADSAKARGATVGVNLTSGLIEALRAGEDPVAAAALALGKAAADGVTAGAAGKTSVPSASAFPAPGSNLYNLNKANQIIGSTGIEQNYYFQGDIIASSPSDAARQGQHMARLAALAGSRYTGMANTGRGYRG